MVYFFHRGDTIFLLGKYTPDGKTKIIEAIVDKTWKNGNVRAYTKGNEPGVAYFIHEKRQKKR